jgi:putative ABC transport system ATP-binding protein
VLGLTVKLIEAMECTAVMVTHNMEHAISLGHRLIVMARGSIIADYSGEDKKQLTVTRLVEDITRKGSFVSDRSALVENPPSSPTSV